MRYVRGKKRFSRALREAKVQDFVDRFEFLGAQRLEQEERDESLMILHEEDDSGVEIEGEHFDEDLYLHLARTFVSLMDLGRSRNDHGAVASTRRRRLVFPLEWLQLWCRNKSDAFRVFVSWSLDEGVTVDKQLECRHLRPVAGSVVCKYEGGAEVRLGQDVPKENWIWDCEPAWLNTVSFRRRKKDAKGYLTPYGQERVDAGSGPRQLRPCQYGEMTLADRWRMGHKVKFPTFRYRVVELEWDMDRAASVPAEFTGRKKGAKDRGPRKRAPDVNHIDRSDAD